MGSSEQTTPPGVSTQRVWRTLSAYLVGFVAFGIVQKNFGLRLDAPLLASMGALAGLIVSLGIGLSRVMPARLLWGICAFGVGVLWALHTGGIRRTTEPVRQPATVLRSQPMSGGIERLPFALVATDQHQWLVKGRFVTGAQGLLHCPAAEAYGEPCRFRTVTPRRFKPLPAVRIANDKLRKLARSIAAIRPKEAGRFYEAVLLGRPGRMRPEVQNSFKQLGIFHLLVTSGLHFAVLQQFFQYLSDGILRLGYSATLIGPYTWFFARRLSLVVSFGALFIYGLGIGLPVAVKRCLVMIGIHAAAILCWWPLTLVQVILLSLVAASLVFPLGFFTVGSLLSWGCTIWLCLWVCPARANISQNQSQGQEARVQLTGFILCQGQLLVMGFLLMGSYTPLAWLANGGIAAVFAPLLVVGFALIASGLGIEFAGQLAQQFLSLVAFAEQLLPIGLTTLPPRSPHGQWASDMIAVAICGIALWRRATSRHEESRRTTED